MKSGAKLAKHTKPRSTAISMRSLPQSADGSLSKNRNLEEFDPNFVEKL